MMKSSCEKFIEDAVSAYSDTVFRVAFQYTRNRSDAEDIVQEVFIRLLKKMPPVTGEKLKAWLIRVTINRSKDYLRANARRRAALSGLVPAAVRQYRSEEYGEVFDELAGLPERDRNALYLHYYEGYTAKEIAGIIGGSERAVTKRIGRAREKLKFLLEEE